MKYNLRLVTGGAAASVEGEAAGGLSPDRPLFDLLDEARKLEAKDRLFNRRLEQAIAQSAAGIGGDARSAWNAEAVRDLRDEHQPFVNRLNELPDLVATTPAYTRRGIIEKLNYLASLLEGVEADIVASAVEDIEHQR